MAIRGMAKSIGVANATPVSGNKRANEWGVSLPYNDLDIRNARNVSCADSRHRTKHNWMCCLLMVISGTPLQIT